MSSCAAAMLGAIDPKYACAPANQAISDFAAFSSGGACHEDSGQQLLAENVSLLALASKSQHLLRMRDPLNLSCHPSGTCAVKRDMMFFSNEISCTRPASVHGCSWPHVYGELLVEVANIIAASPDEAYKILQVLLHAGEISWRLQT